MKKLFLFLIAVSMAVGSLAKADVFDRINDCERVGGGTCVFDLLREIARNNGKPGHGVMRSGTYVSDSWQMELRVNGNQVTIIDNVTTSQAGTYNCVGKICTGPYTFEVLSPDSLRMSYGRTWNRL